jgi:hypothetical protein
LGIPLLYLGNNIEMDLGEMYGVWFVLSPLNNFVGSNNGLFEYGNLPSGLTEART